MNKFKQRIIWFLFISNAFFILIINSGFNFNYFINLIKNYKEILKRNSKFIEDSDYYLIHKKDKK